MSAELASERVVVQSPLSFTGSARRIWRMTSGRAWLMPAAACLVAAAWLVVAVYLVVVVVCGGFIIMAPYRFIRRGQRKRKQESMRHRELLER
jgi:hypothetical protein